MGRLVHGVVILGERHLRAGRGVCWVFGKEPEGIFSRAKRQKPVRMRLAATTAGIRDSRPVECG